MMVIKRFLAFFAVSVMLATGALAQSSAPSAAEPTAAVLHQYDSLTSDLTSLAQNGPTVVFFFATWCPNCIKTLTELSQNWQKVDPAITLVIADYDQEQALKIKYGVTFQDSFVLLDERGGAKKIWNGGGIAKLNENAGLK